MRFEEVIGQEDLKNHLKNLVAIERVSHALLFAGKEGTGNLPLALAFASHLLTLNAEDPKSAQLKCDKLIHPDLHFCYPVNSTKKVTGSKIQSSDFSDEWRKAVLKNPYLDLSEWLGRLGIENKQGRINVHQAKEIVEDLRLKPFEAEYKIMLIWLPEKMGSEPANKLLKILEEPPAKTVFLLVSEHPEQLLATVISRVQMIRVKPILRQDLTQALIQKKGLDPDQAGQIARIAQGNYQEALKLISENEVRAFNQEMFITWMRHLWQKEFLELIQWSEKLSKTGRERLMLFFNYGLHVFRESLMKNYAGEEIQLTGGSEKAFIQKFSPYVNELNVIEMVSLFEEAEYHISRNANPRILLMDVSLKMMKLIRIKVT